MAVSMAEVKELREQTGAGVTVCKQALEQSSGNMKKALEYIREKGLAKAEKRADKAANNGVIAVYEHGVDHSLVALVEVNCETDFVSRSPEFNEFAHEIAMQVAAMKPKFISRDDIPKETFDKEVAIWKEEFVKQGKPEKVLDGIIKGKMESYYAATCLMDQLYFKEDEKKMSDLVSEAVAKFGEKIQIKRFLVWKVGDSDI